MSWNAVIQQEHTFFESVDKHLKSLLETAQQTNNQALLQLHADIDYARQFGLCALVEYEQICQQSETAVTTGDYQPWQIQILRDVGVPMNRWPAAITMITAERYLDRPSEMFRMTMREVTKSTYGRLRAAVMSDQVPLEHLVTDIPVIVEILGCFDCHIQNEAQHSLKDVLRKGILWAGGGVVLGIGGTILTQWIASHYRNWKKGRDASKQLESESQTTEEEEPVLDLDEVSAGSTEQAA